MSTRPYFASLPEIQNKSLTRRRFGKLPASASEHDSDLTWWTRTLADLLQNQVIPGGVLVFDANAHTSDLLYVDGIGTPENFPETLDAIARRGAFIDLDKYIGRSLIRGVLGWSYNSARALVFEARFQASYVVLSLVERAANALRGRLEAAHTTRAASLYSLSTFHSAWAHQVFPGLQLTHRDCSVLLRHYHLAGLCVYDVAGDAISFYAVHPAPVRLEKVDRDIIIVLRTLNMLHASIVSLDRRITEAREGLRAYIGVDSPAAKRALAHARRLEKIKDDKAKQEAKLHEVMYTIEASLDGDETFRAFQTAASLLKTVLKLTPDTDQIQKEHENMQNALNRVSDVQAAITEEINADAMDADDDYDLERELEELRVQEEARKKREEEEEAERKRMEAEASHLRLLQAQKEQRELEEAAKNSEKETGSQATKPIMAPPARTPSVSRRGSATPLRAPTPVKSIPSRSVTPVRSAPQSGRSTPLGTHTTVKSAQQLSEALEKHAQPDRLQKAAQQVNTLPQAPQRSSSSNIGHTASSLAHQRQKDRIESEASFS